MGYFTLKIGVDSKFYFSLHADNDEIILQSEAYDSRRSAENGIDSTQTNASFESRFDRRRSQNDQQYFVLKAANGQVIGTSEMYLHESGLENGIASVMKNAPRANVIDETRD